MVDDDVNKHAGVERVRGPGEFAKLVNAGGAFVEFDERGIHCGQIQRGIRAAEAPEAGVHRGRGSDRQQMNDAAAKFVDDKRQIARKAAKSSRRWQRCIALNFERLELRFQFFIGSRGQVLGRAKQPGKGAVDSIGRAGKIRMDGNARVRAIGPMLPVFFIQPIGLGLEEAHFGDGQFNFPAAGNLPHGQIPPRFAGKCHASGLGGDNFTAALGGAAEVRAEARLKPGLCHGTSRAQLEPDFIADETQHAFAGGRSHDWIGLFHLRMF